MKMKYWVKKGFIRIPLWLIFFFIGNYWTRSESAPVYYSLSWTLIMFLIFIFSLQRQYHCLKLSVWAGSRNFLCLLIGQVNYSCQMQVKNLVRRSKYKFWLSLQEKTLVFALSSETWANSIDLDQCCRMWHLLRVYTICHSASSF